jgi:hypothetical protein
VAGHDLRADRPHATGPDAARWADPPMTISRCAGLAGVAHYARTGIPACANASIRPADVTDPASGGVCRHFMC